MESDESATENVPPAVALVKKSGITVNLSAANPVMPPVACRTGHDWSLVLSKLLQSPSLPAAVIVKGATPHGEPAVAVTSTAPVTSTRSKPVPAAPVASRMSTIRPAPGVSVAAPAVRVVTWQLPPLSDRRPGQTVGPETEPRAPLPATTPSSPATAPPSSPSTNSVDLNPTVVVPSKLELSPVSLRLRCWTSSRAAPAGPVIGLSHV